MFVRRTTGLLWLGMALLAVVALTTWAGAKAPDGVLFKQLYSPKEGTDLAKAMPCLVCHTKMPPDKTVNPYGADLAKVAGGKTIDEKAFRAVEKLDSDKDKFNNIVEIKAGTLPGDPKSKPK